MAKITFLPSGTTVTANPDDYPYGDHGQPGSLLDIALENGVDVAHNCGGACACVTCHVIVQEGEAFLSDMEEDEEDRLDQADGLSLHSRLACQAVVTGKGDVTVQIMMSRDEAGGH